MTIARSFKVYLTETRPDFPDEQAAVITLESLVHSKTAELKPHIK